MLTPTVGVTVNLPNPVPASALKNFTAAGGVAAAGTGNEYVTALVGSVQVPSAQTEVTPVIDEASVDSVSGASPPVVNWVEVIVVFHPAPLPVESSTVIGRAVSYT